MVGITDAVGNHHYLNKAGQLLFGVSPNQTNQFHLSDITRPDIAKMLITEALPVATQAGSWHGESIILDSEGREIPVSQVIICHKTDEGKVAYFSSITRDISDRKASEALLKDTAERQAALNEITAQVVIKQYGQVPPVDCYPSQLNQVFMNIFANAIDALEDQPQPQLIITTEVVNANTPKARAIVRIADNGSGIPEHVQPQVLNPFFTTKPVGKGTGMGMSISYQIITEKHGGKLTFTSEAGKGTEFIIDIPVHQPELIDVD